MEAKNVSDSQLTAVAIQSGVPADLQTCHTAKIAGYVVEGHVPAEDIKRLLAERPKARGLSVPGMPAGSPGMEAGGRKQPYDVVMVLPDGRSSVYAKHNR